MDNEKKPEYLKNLLEKVGQKAANEDPAKDQKKIIAPIKDETTARPEDPSKSERIDRARKEGGAFGRGIGGDSTKAPDGEYKSPRHKIIDKGEQKAGGFMESQTKNNQQNEAQPEKGKKRMSIPRQEFDPERNKKAMDQREQNLKARMGENNNLKTEKAKAQQKQTPQESQSKYQPIVDQKIAQNAQQEQTKKGLMTKIVDEIKNVDIKQAAKVAAPLISRFGGKYGAVVATGVGLAAEIIGENRNSKEKTPAKEGKGNEKITSLKSIASTSTPKAEGKKPEQEIAKKVEKGSSKIIDSLKQEDPAKKTPTPAKKPPTPRR